MELLNSSHAGFNGSDLSSAFTQQVLPPLYLLTCAVGLVLNGGAACVFFRVPTDSALVVFLKNMLVADLLMLTTFPLRLVAQVGVAGWRLHVVMCRYTAVLFYSSMYVGMVFMGLISLERYAAVVRASGGGVLRRLRGAGPARGLALLVWLLLLLCVLPNAVLTSRPARRETSRRCMQLKSALGVQWHRVSTLLCVALFWLTLLLLAFCYASIARQVRRSSRRVRRSAAAAACRRSHRSIFSLLAVFLVCFVPYHVCRVPYTLSQMPWSRFSPGSRLLLFQAKEATLFLSALNVCLDPVVYFLMCTTFRDSLLSRLATGGRRRAHGQSLGNMARR
ncbi:P2Y purinoceptor 14 [Synchiropus splendidus]|uniref:P2Y purinoceptor 14 n=1 Tax=Synchiropus splendidus TaxID=270530 RepID=UPI00237D7951|nr:P2Y purinoceptor 14 [Synchiropus splendidus]